MTSGTDAGSNHGPGGVLAHITLPPDTRAPFLARRLVGSVIGTGPRLRSMDAALLAGELVTLEIQGETPIALSLAESGRTVRVSVSAADPGSADVIVRNLLDRIADRWGSDDSATWFELDLIRRQDLSSLSDTELFELLASDRAARDELFDRYSAFASSISRRFRASGRRPDDIEQVAFLGLVQALERFDPGVGVKFTTFAGRWVSGVIKRYLRDQTWTISVPRSLKNNALDLTRTRAELAQRLGREPGEADLAEALDLSVEDLREAALAGSTYAMPSLDAPVGDDEGSETIGSMLGDDDPDLAIAEQWPAIEAVLDRLPDREQQVLYLRYFEDLTQSEIASMVGVSQVHVSRILRRSLQRIRELLDEPSPAQDD